jgi:hypothetical protein
MKRYASLEPTYQLAFWDMDNWTPESEAQAIAIMDAWILNHGGRL